MSRPRPLKYGLETESETSPSLEYYNIGELWLAVQLSERVSARE